MAKHPKSWRPTGKLPPLECDLEPEAMKQMMDFAKSIPASQGRRPGHGIRLETLMRVETVGDVKVEGTVRKVVGLECWVQPYDGGKVVKVLCKDIRVVPEDCNYPLPHHLRDQP